MIKTERRYHRVVRCQLSCVERLVDRQAVSLAAMCISSEQERCAVLSYVVQAGGHHQLWLVSLTHGRCRRVDRYLVYWGSGDSVSDEHMLVVRTDAAPYCIRTDIKSKDTKDKSSAWLYCNYRIYICAQLTVYIRANIHITVTISQILFLIFGDDNRSIWQVSTVLCVRITNFPWGKSIRFVRFL